jgi:cytochrome c peroxidase
MGICLCLACLGGAQEQEAPRQKSDLAGISTNPVGELRAKANQLLGALPSRMPGRETDTAARIALGRKLYYDKRLSVNRAISCNTCHVLDHWKGGVDGEPTSDGVFGRRGERNAPTVLNAGLHFAQFWDGRAPNLEEQAKVPILRPVEMAMPSEAEALKRLRAVSSYRTRFANAFPGAGESFTFDHVAKAIAAFERTLITHDRFDDFLKGDDRALNRRELKGLELFLSTGCATCHHGPLLGANSYQKVGLAHPYENQVDKGRYAVTKEENDLYQFKVASLRNIALTAPYFHDGSQAKLEEAVAKMAYLQLDRKLAPGEIALITKFLRTLSDKVRSSYWSVRSTSG